MPGCTWQNAATCPKLTAVASDGQSHAHTLSARDVRRIAEAFELSGEVVRADAALVGEWLTNEQALLDQLRNLHAWDDSIGPYYLFWLRGNGPNPPH